MTIVLVGASVILIVYGATQLNRVDYDRKRSSDRLRSSEERLYLAQMATQIGSWEWNVQTSELFWSESCYALLGISPAETDLMQAFLSNVDPEDLPSLERILQQRMELSQVETEYRYHHPQWGLRWIYSRAANASENPVLMRGVSLDVTDRKQAELDRARDQETICRQFAEIEAIYDTAPIGLAVLDCDLRFVRLNQRLAEINGLSIDSHIGRTVREIVPALADEAEPLFRRVLETGEPLLGLEISGETAAQPGVQRTWIENWYPLRDAAGEIIGINAVVQEITHRKRAETALREKEEQLRQLSDAMPQFVWVSNAQGGLEYVNQRWCDYAGLTLEQCRDPSILAQYHHPDEMQEILTQWATALEIHQTFEYEGRLRSRSDNYRWFLIRAVPTLNDQGDVLRWYGTSTDIHDRKLAELDEQFLRDLDQHLRSLTDADVMAQEVVDCVGHYLKVDYCHWQDIDVAADLVTAKTEWRRLPDYPSGLGTRRLSEFALPALAELYYQGQPAVACDVATYPPTAAYLEIYQLHCVFAFVGVPYILAGNWVALLTVTSQTVRAWEAREVTLLQNVITRFWSLIEQIRSVQALAAQTEELRQTNRLKDEFLAALSHELRTPLNPILGWIKMMQVQRLTSAKTTEALEIIERNVKQQIALVDDLLDTSRVIQGKLKLKLQPVDLTSIVQTSVDTVQFAAQAKRIEIEVHQCGALPVIGDRDRLQQVFWNLLNNAIKFTPASGRVVVNFSVNQNSNETRDAEICIQDNGIGISSEFLPYVFDRFRQADGSETRGYGGLGLGLSIVKHLVELHGGTITVESQGVGQGATFTVQLPLSTSSERLASQPTQPSPVELAPLPQVEWADVSPSTPTAASSTALSGIQILLVDDDRDNLDLLRFLLQAEGAVVTALTAPQAALDFIMQTPPDLIISDVGMPQMTGYEFIRQVRALPRRSQIPALALTAFARPADRSEALASGFQAYITKPVDPIELLSTLTQLVQS